MNMIHIVLVNKREYQVKEISCNCIIAGQGKQFITVVPAKQKVIIKHAITGKFKSLYVKTKI